MKLACFVVIAAAFACRAAAQPGDIPTEILFDSVKQAYRSAPFAERTQVVVRRSAPATAQPAPERREDLLVRIDPGRGIDHTGAKLWLELGDLRVAAGNGEIIAIHIHDSASYVRTTYTGPLTPAAIRKALPPLPLPQLDLALGPADPPDRLTSYFDTITWSKAVADDQAAPTSITVTGAAAARKIELVTDSSGHLRELRGDLDSSTQLRLQIRRETIPADATWTISTEGRNPVADLSKLRPAHP